MYIGVSSKQQFSIKISLNSFYAAGTPLKPAKRKKDKSLVIFLLELLTF